MSYDESPILFYKDPDQKNYNIYFTHVPTNTTVRFPAFITAFDDSYASTWNPTPVFGRADEILTFQRTSRTISFSFDMPAASLEEAKRNLSDVRLLTRMLYPTYETDGFATTLKKAPLIRIKFANMIGLGPDGIGGTGNSGLLGALQGFSVSPKIDVGTGFFDPEPGRLYPKVLNGKCTFKVLHEEDPGGWSVSDVVINRSPSAAAPETIKDTTSPPPPRPVADEVSSDAPPSERTADQLDVLSDPGSGGGDFEIPLETECSDGVGGLILGGPADGVCPDISDEANK
tara:strand:+ start:18404 stop:19264 length:861 start_codon:yes stop_codon:yes gene_type:complete